MFYNLEDNILGPHEHTDKNRNNTHQNLKTYQK